MADEKPEAKPEPESESKPEPKPGAEPESGSDALHEELLERRHRRRQALQRQRKAKSRLTDAQQMIFVLLALGFLAAWLFGRDACTRKITQTYGTLTDTPARDAGSPPSRPRDTPPSMRPTDDGW